MFFYAVNVGLKINYGPGLLILPMTFKLYTSYLFGMILFAFEDKIVIDFKANIFFAVFAIFLLISGGFRVFAPILIGLTFIPLFAKFSLTLKYDISYGLYIYAFPVEHLVYNKFGHTIPYLVYIIICIILTSIVAFLSFFFIENPSLKLKSRIAGSLKNKVGPAEVQNI
jgi:hypothetical protein